MIRLAAVALLMLVSAPALSQECQSLKSARIETSADAEKYHGEAIILFGKPASDYLAVVNALPPVTHLAGDGVMLLVLERGTVIGIIIEGRVCVVGRIGAAVHKQAIEKAQGEAI